MRSKKKKKEVYLKCTTSLQLTLGKLSYSIISKVSDSNCI